MCSDSHYERSNVMTNEGLAFSEGRTSSSATLPDDDLVVACVAARAAEFQGYLNVTLIESLQAVRYLPGQEYKIHADWFDDELLLGQDTNRESTFFAVLHADCTHCGTEFPALTVDWSTQDPRWCRIADCDSLDSLIVNAIPGSATFWRNLSPDGKGNPALVHAGLPVQNGTKIGLNIWTHEAKWMQ
jgi:prolyl 4-hydroxylase